jgi:DNA-binding response OmpR family regulator
MFVDADFDIIAVSNGDAAIRKFEELTPAVVLADIYMPGKNGYEVCTYVRKHAERGATPVILLAGAFDAFDGRVAATAGATAHITKPFEPQALVNLVLSVLSKETPAAQPAPAEPVATTVPPAPAAAPPPPAAPPSEPATRAPVAASPDASKETEAEDLLGLQELFKPAAPPQRSSASVTDEEIERIADRVIQKLSTQVIEDVAWHVVPDITTKVLREELKRQS